MSGTNDGPATQAPANTLSSTQIQNAVGIHSPSVEEIFPESVQLPPGLEPLQTESLPLHEQESLFISIQEALENAEPVPDVAVFEGVPTVLFKLWNCQSQYLVQATEALANGSRNPSLRPVYGQAGILGFFLRLIASKEATESNLILHSLRLIGNSCADTDENRQIVVKDNYSFAILRHLLLPELIQVVIPVIYNMCMDFEPAQSQLAANKMVYGLLRLIKDGAFKDNDGLLEYVYELIELVGEQEQGINNSPDGTLSLLIALTLGKDIELELAQFNCLASCLAAYLNTARFQNICLLRRLLPDVLSLLEHSLSFGTTSSIEDAQAITQSRLKINQALAEISDSPLFPELYPLDSDLTQKLKSWLTSTDPELQICACVMLGNLARSDEVCIVMVRDLKIHEELIAVLNSDARGAVLHSALGFLKNLAIASDNRQNLVEAGIIPAISRLWGYETIPQVQLAATSIARQLIISSVENIRRLLQPASTTQESGNSDSTSGTQQTYISLLLALFTKADSTPIKIEVGRIVASLCRTLIPKSKSTEKEDGADALLDHLLSGHNDIGSPLGAMVTQTQWPVVRSEGWFALALMASTKAGAETVVSCLRGIDGFALIEKTLGAEAEKDTEKVQWRKDQDNIVVLVQELLRNEPETLDASWKSALQELMSTHVAKYLKRSE
ncbi:armadillo-type protein [Aspergillus granulosus]|uniref:Armadillo-type protein n=1 Tax=Aspergillus granulosus TaxID=176169 RepID=A0ABR4GXC7_9EURO